MENYGYFLSLHRYYIWATRLKGLFTEAINKNQVTDEITWASDLGLFMSHWYGALFVVVEGYRELGLHDIKVDNLLKSENVELLRRFRNGTFHFQNNYYDNRFVDFWRDSQDTAQWVHNLNLALGEFCLKKIEEEKEKRAHQGG